jgi:heme-degrading monooxygenase HmoA
MFVILWEFEVKPGSEGRFERVYGPKGQWVQLFRRDPHFRGTQLRRDPARPLVYLTIDFWDSETAYKTFQAKNRASYQQLDRKFEVFTQRERKILSLSFRMPKKHPDQSVWR